MFLVALLSWWYNVGWRDRIAMIRHSIAQTATYFSLRDLTATLFSPFRQISASPLVGSPMNQLKGLLDTLISRLIGSFVRSVTIIIGCLVITIRITIGIIVIGIWPIVPVLPVVGILLSIIGLVPE